jgi:hypothetical protein
MVPLATRLVCAALLAVGLTTAALRADAQGAQPNGAPQVSTPANQAPATQTPHRTRARAKKPAVQEAPQTPPPPPTLEQSPPTPPRVSLQNGLLTIDAQNSTLAQVLKAVQSQTGASMEIPGSAGNERVVAQLGPGQPQAVLNTLLNGTKFNYVILGVTGSQGAVQKVILTPRQGGAVGATATAQNIQPQNPQPDVDPQADEGIPVADNNEQQEYQNPNPEPSGPVVPSGGFRRPGIPIQPQDQQNGYQGPGGEVQNGKTPEQLMQELQQMQQQQQVYQQQLNPANQNPQQ